MGTDLGFFIQSLTLQGPGKPNAQLIFADGLNVVSGASDTGKSYALSCIDYAFGAKKPPSPILEAAGYDTVVLAVISRRTNERYVLERGLAGGEVKLARFDEHGTLQEEGVVSAKHSPTDPNTISGLLLTLSELYGKQIRTNKIGSRRTLSFRDVAFLSLVDEERIIARRPPQISGSPIEKTAESEAFRLLVTGDESGAVHTISATKQAVSVVAKLELIGSMVKDAETRFSAMNIDRETVDIELTTFAILKSTALNEYERARIEIASLEEKLIQKAKSLRQIQARKQVVGGLIERFTLLDRHYEADIDRLVAIQESGQLLEALPSQPCPVCGAAPGQHRLTEEFQPEAVEISARAEAAKIGILRRDLAKVLNELKIEYAAFEAQTGAVKDELIRIQRAIDGELMPRVKDSAALLQVEAGRRDLLIEAKNLLAQLDDLRTREVQLSVATVKATTTPTAVTAVPTTAEMDSFAASVQGILQAWNFPGVDRVIFSEIDQDLVISGQPRISHGKGVRALTCAAFMVGLLHHCRVRALPHPSVVLLDSPLVAYREPDGLDTEDQRLIQLGVKDAFYRSLAKGDAKGQVIVFENEDPPDDMHGLFTRIHFSKSSAGRYGLFAK